MKDATARLPQFYLRFSLGEEDSFRFFQQVGAQPYGSIQVEIRIDDHVTEIPRQKVYGWFQVPASV